MHAGTRASPRVNHRCFPQIPEPPGRRWPKWSFRCVIRNGIDAVETGTDWRCAGDLKTLHRLPFALSVDHRAVPRLQTAKLKMDPPDAAMMLARPAWLMGHR